MIHVSGIPSEYIDEVWQDCSKYVEMGINKSQEEMDKHDIYFFLKEKEMQLWVVYDEKNKKEIKAVVTTQIINYPQKKVCRIVTLGGNDMDEWVAQVLDVLEDWSEEQECESMETVCRKGFIKKLKGFGYEQTYTILGKELTTIH